MCHPFSDNCEFRYKMAKKEDWRHPEAKHGRGDWSSIKVMMYESLGTISDQIKQQVAEARESELCKTTSRYMLTSSATEQDGSTVTFIVKEVRNAYFAIDADWEDKTISWSLSWLPPGMF